MFAIKRFVIAVLPLVAGLISSCGDSPTFPPLPGVMTPDHLEEQAFRVSIHRDTTVITRQGIRIHVPANAIAAAGPMVTLLVKEALSLFDMLRAGLTTRSDSRLLSSDGMFHLAFREQATFSAAIQVSIPTVYANPAMQLFSGELRDGRINWKEPSPLQVRPTDRLTAAGDYFTKNCVSCHQVDRASTGPALAWVDRRWKSKADLYTFIRNNQPLLASGTNSYANCLYCAYNKTPMPIYPDLTDSAIADLLAYINREARRMGVPETKFSGTPCDSCDWYAEHYDWLLKKRDTLVLHNHAQKVTAAVLSPVPSADTTGLPTKVSPPAGNAEYYQVAIQAVGWYNIDLLLNADKDFVNGRMTVQLTGNFTITQNIYLIIPSLKIFAEGGLLNDGQGYGFYDQDGSIILPLGRDAYIISLGEEKGKLFMGRHQLTLTATQELTIAVRETTPEQIRQAFAFLKGDQVTVNIQPTRNADSIRVVDAELEQLRKKMKGCTCITSDLAVDTIAAPLPAE